MSEFEKLFKDGVLDPVHPGQIFESRVRRAEGLSLSELAEAAHASEIELEAVLSGNAPVTDSIAQVFATASGSSKEFWTNLQNLFDRVSITNPRTDFTFG